MTAENQSSEFPKEPLAQRNISIEGSADGSTVVAGDGNQVYQGPVSYTTVFNAVDAGQFAPGQLAAARSLSKQAYRWRQVLVEKVKHYWLEGGLERSLHNQVLIELGLEARSAAVRSSVNEVEEFLGESELTSQRLRDRAFPEGTQAGDIFHELGAGRTLLLLGEPGAGKTTVLLKLVQGLLERLGDNLSQPIPVVLNLSSWSKKRQPIEAWLVQELYETFQISKSLGERWIQAEELILCLDGLDEVEATHRNECVQALNQFIQDHGLTEMVVCSRIRDYEALSERLSLRSAICVQALTGEKIDQYLAQAGEQLSALKTVLSQNAEIKEFASSPLILSVISLVYQGCDLADIPQSGDDGIDANRFRQQLFEAYVARMLRRHSNVAQPYSTEQIKHWLHWMATRMVHSSQSIFLIERSQPSWLPAGKRKYAYPLLIVLMSVGLGIAFFGMIHTLLYSFLKGLINGAIVGMMAGLLASLITVYSDEIETVETLRWSWRQAKSACRRGLMYGVLFGLIFGLYNGVVVWLDMGLAVGLSIGLMVCLTLVVISMAISGLTGGLRGPTIQRSVRPNQGIFRSAKNGLIVWGVSSLIVGGFYSFSHLNIGIANGLAYGMIGGLICGGWASWQHFNLRLLFYHLGYAPWDYARFLDYATERLFLQKVGGGYIFVHRMLLEHFAQMELE